ncbi:MAG: hypothetical protein ACOYYS_22710 [Chloroflexota bacterium]
MPFTFYGNGSFPLPFEKVGFPGFARKGILHAKPGRPKKREECLVFHPNGKLPFPLETEEPVLLGDRFHMAGVA